MPASSGKSASSSAPSSGDSSSVFRELLPKRGLLFTESQAQLVLCKPKLLPMKSFTLQKLEKMQAEAKEKCQEQQQQREESDEQEANQQQQANVVSESMSFE